MSLFNQEQTDAYDARVRRLFGAFDEMHRIAAAEVAVSSPSTILCLGAGKGDEIGHISKLLPAAHFVAVDPSPDMPIAGKDRYPDAEWITGTIDQAPLGRFEAATFHLVVHFLSDGEVNEALVGLFERIVPGGRLIVSAAVADGMPESWEVWEREVSARIPADRIPITRKKFEEHCLFRPLGWYQSATEGVGLTGFRLFFRYGIFAGFTVRKPL